MDSLNNRQKFIKKLEFITPLFFLKYFFQKLNLLKVKVTRSDNLVLRSKLALLPRGQAVLPLP